SKSGSSKVFGSWEYSDPQYRKSPFTYKRNKSSAIYSPDVLFWELSSGEPPFGEQDRNRKGRFGVMYKAYSKDEKRIVALKTLYYCDEKSLCKLVNKMSLKIHKLDSEAKTYCVVFQYVNRGDLQCYLNDYFPKLDWPTKIRMAREISKGIKCLHGINIIHLNLHDKNILIHDDGRMIISYFGLSDSSNNSIASTIYERWEYSDPQYLQSPRDGVPPFRALKAIDVIRAPIEGTPIDFKNLYDAAWDGNPDSRPDIREICKKLDNVQLEQDS
ncbi:19545_t:CDS:2, partial [Gigaspora margarita]